MISYPVKGMAECKMRRRSTSSIVASNDGREIGPHAGTSEPSKQTSRRIGTLNEKPLHEALKQWYGLPDDEFEVPVGGFIVDIVRDGLLIEIQTRNFGAIRRKLEKLVGHHRVTLVYPIPCEKWIIKVEGDAGLPMSRRRSPKHGTFEQVFEELVSFPKLLDSPNFSIELLLVREEEVRRHDGHAGWRRGGWVTHERRLLKVLDRRTLNTAADLSAFIPAGLAEPFTASELAVTATISRRLAQKITYCLRQMGCIAPTGKRANSILYTRVKHK